MSDFADSTLKSNHLKKSACRENRQALKTNTKNSIEVIQGIVSLPVS